MNNDKGKLFYGVGLDNAQLRADAAESKNIIRGIGDSMVTEGSRIDGIYRKIGATIAVAFSFREAAEFTKKMVEIRGEFQKLETSLGVLLQSKDKANAMMSDVVRLAATTPFSLQDVASGSKQLLAYGIAAEDTVDDLRMLGDVAAGLGLPMQRLTYLYGTTMTQGRLYTRDLLQFTTSGIPMLQALADLFGVTTNEVFKLVEAGKVGFPEVKQAIANMTSEGGQFSNMMGELSKTIPGKIEKLKDAIDVMFNDMGKSQEGVINDAIDSAAYLVEHYQEVGEILAAIVATYGTYRAAIIATAAVNNTITTIKHTEEAASLYQLLTVEQQAQISKQGLSKSSAEYYALVKAETAANVQATQSTLVKARADVKAASESVAARRAEYIAAKQLEEQRLAELMSIGATGTAKQVEAAQRKLSTAETQRESAAIAFQSATRDFNAKKTAVETAARAANTTAAAANTAAETANATATGFLTVAKTRLAAVASKLNKVIMANPYAFAAAAVIALGYGIYKLVTYQTEAERTTTKLNDTIKEGERATQAERYQIDLMFQRLLDAKKGTEEYEVAKQAIISQYGGYLKKLGDEKNALNDIAAAYTLITEEATKSARARAMQQVITEASGEKATKSSDTYDEIAKLLKKKFGAEKGGEYLLKLKPVIMDGAEMTAEMQAIISQFDKFHYARYDAESGIKVQDEYTSNAISDKLASLAKVNAAADRMIREAQEKFGPNTQTEEPTIFDAATASLQQLMDKLPKAKEELAALKAAEQPDTAAIAAKEKEIQQINAQTTAREKSLSAIKDVKAQIKLLQDEQEKYGKDDAEYKALETRIKSLKTKLPATEGQSNKSESDAARIKRETAERNQKIQEYTESVAKQVKQSELDIAQARIDAMDEGFNKEIAQNEQAYNRLIFANQQREAEMLEALRDARELEWENKNPKAKAKGKTFDRSSVTVADLSSEQRAAIAEYYKVAEEIREKANKDSLEKILSDVMTYEQQRTKIAEDYEKQREQLYNHDDKGNRTGLKQGVTQGNVDELDRNEQEALKAVDEEFAQREETYQSWMSAIGNMTLSQLQVILAQAEKELAELEKSGTGDSKKTAVARAKVNTAKQKVAKANADNDVSPNKRTIKEWEDLYKTLREVENEFESIGDTVGGVAGEIISTAGKIMSSTLTMINGIVQLVNMSATGMQGTAIAAASAISTVEKASVILTVISAALQIAMTIVNLFNNDEEYQKEIEKLQGRIDQLQWELDNADAVRLQNNTFNALQKLKQVYSETTAEVLKLHLTANQYADAMYRFYGTAIYQNDILIKSAEKLATAYANIAYTADKALGEAKYDNAKSQLENIAQQQLLIQEQIDKENAKKKTDHGAIEEWERKIQELGEEANKIINEIVEDIIGGTSEDIANDLADAFFDAFQAGEDYAEAWGDKVKDIVGDVIKRMLVSKYLEEPLGAIFDKYKSQWYKDGEFAGIDAVIASMSGFAADLNTVGDEFKVIWENLPDSVKNMFTVTDDAAREASQKGIATASQESVDENNGRLTAIQGHTYSLMEYSRQLVANSAMILDVVMGIKEDTKYLDRLDPIEKDMKTVKDTVNDIALKGIKLK